jgi:hypothetical protein
MLKTSGLILDAQDDVEGAVLREVYPSIDLVPETIKTAHVLQPDEREALPDDLFALILTGENETTLRKFACVDRGNTELSMQYFLKTAHRLPVEAQKVAAANFMKACTWYDITPPEEISKIAIGLMTALTLPSTIQGTGGAIKRNLDVARASGSAVNPAVARTT